MPPSSQLLMIPLPEIMDIKAASPLAAELNSLRGCPVALDASAVRHLGGLCLQVLLSARLSWTSDNVPLEIVGPSTAFKEALALFGAASFADQNAES